MNYLAQGLNSGFGLGFQAATDAKARKQKQDEELARRKLEEEMLDKRIVADAKNQQMRIEADDRRWMNSEQNRHINRAMDIFEADLRRQMGNEQQAPRNRLLNAQALAQELENKRALAGPGTPPPPMAKVRKTFGPGNESYFEYQAPLSDIERTAANAPTTAYKSPFAREISQQSKIIAENTAQLQSGDVRSGFLGMTNRGDTVRKAQAQLQKLRALELEDMVQKGAITQAEADRRADLILNGQ